MNNTPTRKTHSGQKHSMGPQEFTRQLHRQSAPDRKHGFEPLHVYGRAGFLMKATLLTHGYTVIREAASY
ncbi:hypothetical protein PITC_094640 [Penicillium italicum]|uniref:Uncharacterized protein n=1 Tax=Penicillium italicum TaxID=40296 RepID=A0A0A2KQX7_PENIT|nr:hypothetical protein PITC_094640 [Penicillium italicum]